jgi:predicted amidohydrolase YtcJ
MRSRHSRRGFIGLTTAGIAGAFAPPLSASRLAATASTFPYLPAQSGAGTQTSIADDLLVLNAKVFTVDSASPRAEAFLVRGGRFAGVGTTAAMKALAGPRAQTFDAKGMTIVPGFIDCHNHPIGTTLLYEVLVGNPFEVEFVTIASIVDKLKARAKQLPAGTWVEGYFHDDTKLKDKRSVHMRDLDQVSTEHPVVVNHRGGHTSFYNSKAFEMAKITNDTPNPDGGTFDRDPDGKHNGRATDLARDPFSRVGTRPTFTPEERVKRERDGIAHISMEFVRYGLTTVHHQGGDLAALQDVRSRGELKHRVSYESSGRVLDSLIASGVMSGFGDDWLRFGATSEHTVDGSFSERTMSRSTPYPGSNPPYYGNITEKQDELNAWVERVHRAGIQVNCHANGDTAIDMYLTAFERAQKLAPKPDARPKITHCTLITDDLVRRMKAVGAVPALFTTYAYYNPDKFVLYGEEFMKRSMAFRTLLDAGIRVCAGSDFYPGPFAPLMGIQGMVTRTGWDGTTWGANQRISVDEAIAVNTINGAYASREESIKGSIAEGKLADFVVLADDPHTVGNDKIKDIKIVRTVVGGQTVYSQ